MNRFQQSATKEQILHLIIAKRPRRYVLQVNQLDGEPAREDPAWLEDVEEEEDTSPPIRVGKKQSVAEIRKRVRELMTS